jgi:hypothetical protein
MTDAPMTDTPVTDTSATGTAEADVSAVQAPVAYLFDYTSGESLGPFTLVDRSADGEWLMPGNATLEAPPVPGPRQAARWTGAAWEILPDHRRETWWTADGARVTIASLGDPAADGLLATAPQLPPTPDQARAECARRINAAASQATQLNLNAYLNVLNAKANLSTAEQADVAAFAQAVGWIAAMRANWKILQAAGDVNYRQDAKWPALPASAAALASRF